MSDTLTPDAVLAMPAGRELDELVATRVLGWKRMDDAPPHSWLWNFTSTNNGLGMKCPELSQDMARMGVLINWLRERWERIGIVYDNPDWVVWKVGTQPHFAAPTLPLALCRAALLASLREGK